MENNRLLQEMGERVYARRKELRLTQEQVAERMDVSVQMISNLELGKKAIRPENLVKLCEVLNISADYILLGRYYYREPTGIEPKFYKLSLKHQRLIEELINSLIEP